MRRIKKTFSSIFTLMSFLSIVLSTSIIGQTNSAKVKNEVDSLKNFGGVWIPDNGDGTYTNPIINADYSDPDVIRVGDDYYMTSSSFSHFPGLPILHSKDLVNWKIIGHAVLNYSIKSFDKPQHGGGIWAPCIRYHSGEYYIYFGDPDYGIFMTKAKNPAGPWEPLHLVKEAKGWIDPSPFWDDDGNAYLVHAWARSRSGIKHVLTIKKMSADGKKFLDDGVNVFCDSVKHPTLEGPKFYKRNGYYYIFAPAGGVKPGWQTILRSKNIYGPYEDKIVLEQGTTKINGPHQGAWITTKSGEDWFIHFQDRYAFGRVVHLQPMRWEDDWPVMGIDYDGNGIGEPVSQYKKPKVDGNYPVEIPQTNDEFNSEKLGLQWQWQADYSGDSYSLSQRSGWLRLHSKQIDEGQKNLWSEPRLLLQKFPASNFSVTTKLEFNPVSEGEKAGLIIFGLDYSYIAIEKKENGFYITDVQCKDADKSNEEVEIEKKAINTSKIFFKVEVKESFSSSGIPIATCRFAYSEDGIIYINSKKEFIAREGKWVGAKIGIFGSTRNIGSGGSADFEWIRFNN